MLAWYLADELSVTYVPRLAKRRQWLAEVDPDHPTFACYCRYDQLREYLPSVDVFSTDVYPVPHNPLRRCADITRITDEGLFGSRCLWQVPQTFTWKETRTTLAANGRFPTRDEMRSMCWQMIAAGSNGLLGYCLHQCIDRFTGEPVENRWADVCAVFSDIRRFTYVFLAGGDAPATTGVPGSLAVRTFREGRDVWVLACNLENAATEAGFKVDGVGSGVKVAVVYGAGLAYAGDGMLKASMTPYDVCLIHLKEEKQ